MPVTPASAADSTSDGPLPTNELGGTSEPYTRIAELQQALTDAEAKRHHLRVLFEQAPMALAVLRGPTYVIELANPAVCAVWGRTLDQALHTPLLQLLPEIAGQGIIELLDGVRTTGVPYAHTEMPVVLIRHGRSETVYFNFTYHPLRELDGQITGVTVVATEVSAQVLARHNLGAQQQLNEAHLLRLNEELAARNQELSTANAQLIRTNSDLDNFIYTASHDLKAPITNIEGLLAALRQHLPDEAYAAGLVPRLLDLMQGAVGRFQGTIAQLTDITKLQVAHTQSAEAVDLALLVEAVRLDLVPMLAAAGAHLTVDVSTCPIVSFAPQNLRSIVYNLISNAVKYRAPDRTPLVWLRCYSVGTEVVLSVQDNGLGLDAAQQTKLFGLFQRLHTHVEGSGIGLYMVKKIVTSAGGAISVKSQPGVGSTFTVSFPGVGNPTGESKETVEP